MGFGIAAATPGLSLSAAQRNHGAAGSEAGSFDVRCFGASSDGSTIDTAAVTARLAIAADRPFMQRELSGCLYCSARPREARSHAGVELAGGASRILADSNRR